MYNCTRVRTGFWPMSVSPPDLIHGPYFLPKPGAIPSNITFEDLSNVVKRVAHERFRFQYGYDYLGQQSKPPSDDPQNKITSTEGICSFDRINDEKIAQYIDQRILKYDRTLD